MIEQHDVYGLIRKKGVGLLQMPSSADQLISVTSSKMLRTTERTTTEVVDHENPDGACPRAIVSGRQNGVHRPVPKMKIISGVLPEHADDLQLAFEGYRDRTAS